MRDHQALFWDKVRDSQEEGLSRRARRLILDENPLDDINVVSHFRCGRRHICIFAVVPPTLRPNG